MDYYKVMKCITGWKEINIGSKMTDQFTVPTAAAI